MNGVSERLLHSHKLRSNKMQTVNTVAPLSLSLEIMTLGHSRMDNDLLTTQFVFDRTDSSEIVCVMMIETDVYIWCAIRIK